MESNFAGIPTVAWIPLLPLLGALINLTLGRRLSKQTVHTIAIAAVAGACGLALYLVFGDLVDKFRDKPETASLVQTVYTWIEVGSFKAQLAFRLDTLSAVMVLIITFVGALIHIYSTGYMAHDPRYAAFFGYLNLFTGAMLILVLGANLPVMFIGWEGVGLCSYLLIGFWFENDAFASAGRKAFIVNRIGDLGFLLGMFLLFWATKDVHLGDPTMGSLDFANLKDPGLDATYVATYLHGDRLAAAAGILLFIGACGKSAQIPLYVWLPDAMAGPTPVSALIHAATMVTAGVYMVCRMSFLYSSSTTAMIVVATIGLLTALAAAFMAFAQTDLKKVLAYSTVSQLGFMFVAAGTGNWTAAIFHLMTHAFFKACLFLGAGSVMHGMEHGGSTTPGDITTMGGLRKHMKITRITFLISCLAIAGVAPFAGFFSKDEILGGAWSVHPPGWPPFYGKILWAGLAIAALGTAFYMWRLYFLVFSGEERSEAAKHAHESPSSMTVPLIILAGLASIAGLIGLPHLEGVHLPGFTHAFAHWLEPSVSMTFHHEGLPIHGEVSDATTIILMIVALAIGLTGIGLAWMFYGRGKPSPTVDKLTDVGPLAGLYEASKHKLWVDEFYDAVIVRPFRALARGLLEIVDKFIIDTVAVNGSAFVVGLFGRLSRWFQNGQVQRYLVGVVIGAAGLFAVTQCRHRDATFTYTQLGDQLEFRADTGFGLAKGVKYRWDFDGDGEPDRDPDRPDKFLDKDVVTKRLGDVGARVTLWVDDPVSQKTEKVTLPINLPDAKPLEGGK
jgi:NADH-quinone oxidoreductase subunit L